MEGEATIVGSEQTSCFFFYFISLLHLFQEKNKNCSFIVLGRKMRKQSLYIRLEKDPFSTIVKHYLLQVTIYMEFHYVTEVSTLCGKVCLQLIVCRRKCHPLTLLQRHSCAYSASIFFLFTVTFITILVNILHLSSVPATTLPVYKAPFASSNLGIICSALFNGGIIVYFFL